MPIRFLGPYWRLAGFYFWYFAGVGALVPYMPVLLQARGCTTDEISAVMAAIVLGRIVAPYCWGAWADSRGGSALIIQMASLGALGFFAITTKVAGAPGLMFSFFLFGVFWSGALPQVEALTLKYCNGDSRVYSWTRVWGSIGYILTVILVGRLVDTGGIETLNTCLLTVLAGLAGISILLPSDSSNVRSYRSVWLPDLVLQKGVPAFLLVTFLMQLGHGPYYTFYSIHLKGHGYNSVAVGQLWALGVVSEVVVFLAMQSLVNRFSLRSLLLSSLLLAGARWVLIGYGTDRLSWLVGAQLLHAGTFGIFHAVSVQMVYRLFAADQHGRGQALYSSIGYGAGGASGALISGLAWSVWGGSEAFLAASVIAFTAFAFAWGWLPNCRGRPAAPLEASVGRR